MPKRTTLIAIIAAVVAAIAGALVAALLLISSGTTASQGVSAADASSTVAAFGQVLQQVSILAPDASSTIASVYAPYVAPSLLAQWEANPSSAPGRVVSSPWPDHIQINSITAQGSGYVVDGTLVFLTSNEVEHGGAADTTPVIVQLASENGTLQIVAFQGQNGQQ